MARRTKSQREAALAELATLIARGRSQRLAASELKVAQSTINADWKELCRRWNKRNDLEIDVIIEQLHELMAEAWDAWERSKADRERSITEKRKAEGKKGTRGTLKATKVQESRLPDAAYLRIVLDCLDKLIRLGAGMPKMPAESIYSEEAFFERVERIRVELVRLRDGGARHVMDPRGDGPPQPVVSAAASNRRNR